MIPSTLKTATALLLAALSASASAIQIVEGVDGETLFAKVSQRELTRVAVEHGRITKVTGNAGEFLLEKDDDNGQIYIRPAAEGSTKPINLFITTDAATFALLLQPVDVPADSIIIKDRKAAHTRSPGHHDGTYVSAIKKMLLAVAGDTLPHGMEVRETQVELALWKEVRFVRTRSYLNTDIIGEKFLLTNVSATPLDLAEPELYKPGVLAVSVEKHRLLPDAATNVFIMRERDDRD